MEQAEGFPVLRGSWRGFELKGAGTLPDETQLERDEDVCFTVSDNEIDDVSDDNRAVGSCFIG